MTSVNQKVICPSCQFVAPLIAPALPDRGHRHPWWNRRPLGKFAGVEDTMRKVFSLLDDEQRQALIEVVDLGTAVASAGLIVSIFHLFVDLVT